MKVSEVFLFFAADEREPLVIVPGGEDEVEPASSSQVDSKAGIKKLNIIRPLRVSPDEVLEILDSDDEVEPDPPNTSSSPANSGTAKTPVLIKSGAPPAVIKEQKHVAKPTLNTFTPNRKPSSNHTATPSPKSAGRPSAQSKPKGGKEKHICPVPSCRKEFSSKMEGFVHWNINHDFSAVCFTCKDCSSVKSWPREPFIGHINQVLMKFIIINKVFIIINMLINMLNIFLEIFEK